MLLICKLPLLQQSERECFFHHLSFLEGDVFISELLQKLVAFVLIGEAEVLGVPEMTMKI